MSEAKLSRLEARISTDQKQFFQQAAYLLGRSLTDFIIGTFIITAPVCLWCAETQKIPASSRGQTAPTAFFCLKAVERFSSRLFSFQTEEETS